MKPWNYGAFDGRRFDGNLEFDPATQPVYDPEKRPRFYKYERPEVDGEVIPLNGTKRAPVLKKLFQKAQEECEELGVAFAR